MENEIKEVDVAIIGNGPSAITLSYMLSGYTPYYHPTNPPEDDLLHLRLANQDYKCVPITEMNLRNLSDGLEGRTSNPVALVLDQLCHPYADTGYPKLSSQLRWVKEEKRAINHIVIGRNSRPGGVWQKVQGDLKTLSRSSWMQLPDLPFTQYLKEKKGTGDIIASGDRADVCQVTRYYEEYVKEKALSSNFLNSCLVTSVEKVRMSPQIINEDTGEMEGDAVENIWEVSIKRLESSTDGFPQSFRVRAKNIVLATGTSDIPNVLGVPGEDLKFIRHGVSKVSAALHHIDNETRCNPVLVIGAGLSAADAIITARKNNCNIVHVFRETPCGNPAQMLKSLPRAIYPEYVMMYELMCGDVTVDWYKPYPQYAVKAFIDKNRVRLESLQGRSEIIDVSLALVQIGSNADLSFMPSQGTNLGVVPGMKIEVKHNVVDVDPFTSESVIEKGLYAMGPLIGDNFVRFLKGGAMAITQHIQMKNGVINM